ncbi:MAG: hydrogenase 2 large subunit, partial [Acidobacteria bacterium]
KGLLEDVQRFVEQVYLVGVAAIAAMNAPWLSYGAGVTNYLSVPDLPTDTKGTTFDLPGGTIFNGDLKTTREFESFDDPYFRDNITENITRAWYEDTEETRHPFQGQTNPAYSELDHDGKYSWVKAPRFNDQVMQVGPLAQVLVGFAGGHKPTQKWATWMLKTAGAVAGAKLGPGVLHSTLGRHAARAIRAAVIVDTAINHWQRLVENIGGGDSTSFTPWDYPKGEVQGFGFHEAPRGTLSHWVVIEDGKIKNYQCVVPSTWNAGPRDDKGRMGPYEASLIDNPVADPERPLEVLRTIHSFDPCLACAIHTLDPDGNERSKVRTL